jgi:hypothetical protein
VVRRQHAVKPPFTAGTYRPAAAVHGRQLAGKFEITAIVLDTLVIEKILT